MAGWVQGALKLASTVISIVEAEDGGRVRLIALYNLVSERILHGTVSNIVMADRLYGEYRFFPAFKWLSMSMYMSCVNGIV